MIRSKEYITGDYMEIEIFNLPAYIKPFKRKRKIRESTPAQKNLNDKRSKRYLIRLIHNNFTSRDLFVDLTYDNEHLPETRAGVAKDVRNYIKRLQRTREKEGLDKLKYVYVISCSDQEGNKVRWHVHMIINGMDRDTAEDKWGKGFADAARLQFGDTGITGRAIYMFRQSKHERSWSCSLGLKKPEATVSDHKISKRQMQHMGTRPDDRQYIEKIINGRGAKRAWTFTDCQVEYNGQMIMDGIYQDNHGYGNGISLLIRARRINGNHEKGIRSDLLSHTRDQNVRTGTQRAGAGG